MPSEIITACSPALALQELNFLSSRKWIILINTEQSREFNANVPCQFSPNIFLLPIVIFKENNWSCKHYFANFCFILTECLWNYWLPELIKMWIECYKQNMLSHKPIHMIRGSKLFGSFHDNWLFMNDESIITLMANSLNFLNLFK